MRRPWPRPTRTQLLLATGLVIITVLITLLVMRLLSARSPLSGVPPVTVKAGPAVLQSTLTPDELQRQLGTQISKTIGIISQLDGVVRATATNAPNVAGCQAMEKIPEWDPLSAPAELPTGPRNLDALMLLLAGESRVAALWHSRAAVRALCSGLGRELATLHLDMAMLAINRAAVLLQWNMPRTTDTQSDPLSVAEGVAEIAADLKEYMQRLLNTSNAPQTPKWDTLDASFAADAWGEALGDRTTYLTERLNTLDPLLRGALRHTLDSATCRRQIDIGTPGSSQAWGPTQERMDAHNAAMLIDVANGSQATPGGTLQAQAAALLLLDLTDLESGNALSRGLTAACDATTRPRELWIQRERAAQLLRFAQVLAAWRSGL